MDMLARWAPTMVSILVLAIAYGRLTGRVDSHGEQFKSNDKRFDGIDNRLDDHAVDLKNQGLALAKLEAWRDGYNAATARLKEG
jgi:hypothetical protein